MDQTIKLKWIDALRSGKYAQAIGDLHVNYNGANSYCCLGVLCDVLGADWNSQSLNGKRIPRESENYLTNEILDEVGLDDKTQKVLGKMNDGAAGFNDIADYIEKNL